jgi:UDP-glucose 4-epimerase
MRILVTGGAGFIGTNLIRRLVADGNEVRSIDNYSVGTAENHVDGCEYIDLRNVKIYEDKIFNSIDVCYHLAALSRIQPSFVYPISYFESNVTFTNKLLANAILYRFKFIYAGSSSRWHDPHISPYATYKFMSEQICMMYNKCFDVDTRIARFYNVYGPHEITEGDQAALIGKWRGMITKGEPLTIVGDGNQVRDFTHVDDIVDGLVKIMHTDSKLREFELGADMPVTINKVYEMFKARYPNITHMNVPDQKGNYPVSVCDNHDARTELGWLPTRKLEDYIANL